MPKTFQANTDNTTPVQNLFSRDVLTQFVRVYPLTPGPQGYGIRLEILGCSPDNPVPPDFTGNTPSIRPPTVTGDTPNHCKLRSCVCLCLFVCLYYCRVIYFFFG